METINNRLPAVPDIYFIQELDQASKRTYYENQIDFFESCLAKNVAFSCNYKSLFVPFPFPPMGKVYSGIATFSNYETTSADRMQLPCLFKWPVRVANLKRGLLVTRTPVYKDGKNTGKELVLINFHLEAFDSGDAKEQQTKMLTDVLKSEYAKGNYVIAGGDCNQKFPNDSGKYPLVEPDGWQPGIVDASFFPSDWQIVTDDTYPTCRAMHAPYTGKDAEARHWQYWVIDGFFVSPNIKVNSIKVIDQNFEYSDHNPVLLNFSLK